MIRFILNTVLFLTLLWVAALIYFISIIPSPKPASDIPPADAIFVLTGGLERIPYGLELLHLNKAKTLFISGVFDKADKNAIFQRKPMHVQQIYKIHQDQIKLGRDAKNTKGNAIEVSTWLQKNPAYKKIIIVTGHFHLPRSFIELKRKVSQDIALIAAPVLPKPFTHKDWWQNRRAVEMLLSEFHKFLAVNIHYFIVDLSE